MMEENKAPQIKISEDPMSVGDWIGSILLLMLLLIVFAGLLWGIYCICITIDTNLTISTHEGWNYLGEGTSHSIRTVSSTDCYGNPTSESFPNGIGDIEVKADKVYTPVVNWCGFDVLPFSTLYPWSYGLKRDTVYRLYEKKYWFSSNYLVICK